MKLEGLIKLPVTMENLKPMLVALFVSEVELEEDTEEEKDLWGKC